MSAAAKRLITAEEYLRIDREARERCDFYRGEMFAMAGGSKEHNQIIQNLGFALREHFRKTGRPCRTYLMDMRVEINSQHFYVYPDLSVVCGEAHFLDGRNDTLLNPLIIVEVLSDSTEVYDRGAKSHGYLILPSIQEYLLVSQKKQLVERFSRTANGKWELEFIDTESRELVIPSLDFRTTFAEIYFDVEFPPTERIDGRSPS